MLRCIIFFGHESGLGQNRPTSSTSGCLLSPAADIHRGKIILDDPVGKTGASPRQSGWVCRGTWTNSPRSPEIGGARRHRHLLLEVSRQRGVRAGHDECVARRRADHLPVLPTMAVLPSADNATASPWLA